MYLIPFRTTTQQTSKNFESISKIVEKICVLPAKMDVQTFINHRVLEYEIRSNSFMILMGRYGFSYGITNLAPVLNGKFIQNNSGNNLVKFTICPKLSGIITLIFLYTVAITCLVVSVKRNELTGILTAIAFMSISYWAIISRFNKEMKHYDEVIAIVTAN